MIPLNAIMNVLIRCLLWSYYN